MSYTRDPDHYTRGIGAVQAVDKVLSRNRGRARRAADAALESQRRDRLKSKLMRPALGAVMKPTFGRMGSNMAPVVTSGGVVEGGGMIGGGGAINTGGGMFGSGGGGGGVSPTNGVKGRTFTLALNAANTGVLQPMSPPTYVGICVDARGNKIPCPPPATGGGPVWNPNSGIVPPVYSPPPPASTSGGPASTTDPTTSPTSSVGLPSGGPSGVMTTLPPDGSPSDNVDSDTTVLAPTGPDYKTYAMYAGGAVALFLLYREFTRSKR